MRLLTKLEEEDWIDELRFHEHLTAQLRQLGVLTDEQLATRLQKPCPLLWPIREADERDLRPPSSFKVKERIADKYSANRTHSE